MRCDASFLGQSERVLAGTAEAALTRTFADMEDYRPEAHVRHVNVG